MTRLPSDPSPEIVGLVSCVKLKRRSPAAARHLYVSPLFLKMSSFADLVCDRWFVLSAKYGLLAPDDVVAPYEQTLKEVSAGARAAWAEGVAAALGRQGLVVPSTRFLWLAGKAYQRDLRRHLGVCSHWDPLHRKRMGERLAWLKRQLESDPDSLQAWVRSEIAKASCGPDPWARRRV